MGQQAMGATSPGSGGAAPKDTYMRNPVGGTVPGRSQTMMPGPVQTMPAGGSPDRSALAGVMMRGHPGVGAPQQMGPSPGMGGGPAPGGLGGPGMGGVDPRIAQMLAGVHPGGGPTMGNVQQLMGQQGGMGGGPMPGQGMPSFMNPNPQLRSMQGPAVNVPGMYAGMPGAQQGIASLMQHFGIQQPGATQ